MNPRALLPSVSALTFAAVAIPGTGQERQYGYGSAVAWEAPDPLAAAAANFAADVNRDSMHDLIRCYRSARSGAVTVSVSNGSSFAGEVTWLSSFARFGEVPLAGDFN